MRRLLGRLRTSRAGALYHRLDGTSEDDGRPWMIAFADTREEGAPQERTELVGAERTQVVAAERTETVREPERAPVSEHVGETAETPDAVPRFETAPLDPTATESDPGLVPALNRVADAFERMAANLEIEHREREVRLAAVEQLLRELVAGLAQPTAVPPVVLGGSIDLETLGGAEDGPDAGADGPDIDLVGPPEPPEKAVKKPAAARRTKRT
jgi:hypothetical protein